MIILVSNQLVDGPVYGWQQHNFILGLTNVKSDHLTWVFSKLQQSIIIRDANVKYCTIVCGVDQLSCPFPIPLVRFLRFILMCAQKMADLLPKFSSKQHAKAAKRPWLPNCVDCLLKLADASMLQSSIDVILGLMVSIWLYANRENISNSIHLISYYTIDVFERSIIWLMGWPAGFKLNAPLDKFLGDLYLWMISLWAGRL